MSLNVSILSDIEPIENLPQYCNYHKFLLVEELMLVDDYTTLHYGKCRLIGKVFSATGEFYLENVRIPHISEEYALPEGALQIQLIPTAASLNNCSTLEHGKYYEILGEVKLLPKSPNQGTEILTSRGVVERVQSGNRGILLQQFKNLYKTAVNVWFAFQANEASELISRNLEIRMLESVRLR